MSEDVVALLRAVYFAARILTERLEAGLVGFVEPGLQLDVNTPAPVGQVNLTDVIMHEPCFGLIVGLDRDPRWLPQQLLYVCPGGFFIQVGRFEIPKNPR